MKIAKLTWASCRVQHESHWNLLSLQRVSVLLKFFKQLVIEVFCSTSIDRSKKSSSLLVTVSQLRQRVSLVKMPWKMSEIQVGFLLSGWSLFIGVLLPLPLCCWLLSAVMRKKKQCKNTEKTCICSLQLTISVTAAWKGRYKRGKYLRRYFHFGIILKKYARSLFVFNILTYKRRSWG